MANALIESNKKYLTSNGLTEEEATTFLTLFEKIVVSDEDEANHYNEMDDGIPYEGGMCFTEGVIAARIALADELAYTEIPGPIWEHNCDECLFLATFQNQDLYYCEKNPIPSIPTIIARYSNEPGDYISGMEFGRNSKDDPNSEIGEAYRIVTSKRIFVDEENKKP